MNGLNREVQDVPYLTPAAVAAGTQAAAGAGVLDDNTYFETPGLVARKAQLAPPGLAGLMLLS